MVKRIFIIVFVMIFSGTALFAQGRKMRAEQGKGVKEAEIRDRMMHGCPMTGSFSVDALKLQLKLSDEQVNKINELQVEHRKAILKFREELAPKEIRLERLLMEDTVNFEEVKTLVMDIYKIKGEMKIKKIAQWLDIEKILTPEQRIKFKAMNTCPGRPMRGGERMRMRK